jgi:hypothetical protein
MSPARQRPKSRDADNKFVDQRSPVCAASTRSRNHQIDRMAAKATAGKAGSSPLPWKGYSLLLRVHLTALRASRQTERKTRQGSPWVS